MSPQWKFKLAVSVLVALMSTLYQLETDDELLVTNKKVLLSKNISRVFTALSDLEEYPSFIPNMAKLKPVNKAEPIAVGRRYTLTQTYIFGIGESQCSLTVINLQRPDLFEFMADDFLLLRHRLTFARHESDEHKTRVAWDVYSRKRSYLFKYSVGVFYQFYYSQILREGLFKLQFMVKDSA